MSDEPRTTDARRAFRVGALALLSGAILVAILIVTGPLRVVSGKRVRVDFAFAGPIKPGASVRVSGVVIGSVTSVDLLVGQDREAGADKMVRVRATIESRAAPVVTDKALFRVTTLGVLGEHYLDIEPVPGGAPLPDDARVDGISGARPDLLLARAAGLLEKVDTLLPQSPEAIELMRAAAALMKRVDAVLQNGDLGQNPELKSLADDIRTLVHGAAVGVGDGRTLHASLDRLPAVLDKTQQLETELDDAGAGALVTEVRASLKRVDAAVDLLERQPLADPVKQQQLRDDLTATLRSLDGVMHRADRLLGVVEARKGGAGKLFWDEDAADDLRAVLKGVRDDPVKFLLNPRPKDH